ncbi:hypothetical protein K470DRAFT_98809 [Piedraia hortae CBS 480.64]|uniref:Uncharacterized protein n=1 Tax=Piedraia hortae CBS 480.64 TaxID=1314780 RepID=A0A6A7BVZ5_9PEZI|nr:hypothetical protein K470DRAFT_98809 [Piedraia hortae CBS 480.64]
MALFRGHSTQVLNISFAEGGRRLVSASTDGTLCLWDIRTKSLERWIKFSCSDLQSVSFSPFGDSSRGESRGGHRDRRRGVF